MYKDLPSHFLLFHEKSLYEESSINYIYNIYIYTNDVLFHMWVAYSKEEAHKRFYFQPLLSGKGFIYYRSPNPLIF